MDEHGVPFTIALHPPGLYPHEAIALSNKFVGMIVVLGGHFVSVKTGRTKFLNAKVV